MSSATLGGVSLRSDVNGWLGGTITVGGADVEINALARRLVTGNSQTHQVKITTTAGVLIASVDVDTSAFSGVDWAYEFLGSPVTLSAGVIYHIQSEETIGGDQWYNAHFYSANSEVTPGSVAYGTGTFANIVSSPPGAMYCGCNFYISD